MLTQFASVFVFMLLGALTVFVMVGGSRLLQPRDQSAAKLTTYECGEPTIGSSWVQFNIRFYVLALVFVVFDVEVALLYPWAVIFKQFILEGQGGLVFVEALIFIVILISGLAYLWKEGDLEWVRSLQGAKARKANS
ncbi:MAG TPA: NADH-quinone oxidoreductase subunit A [Candidatus Deferrimicrobiaceae bacterium]|jgi:NADH-quinone oxidoreductase subunit A